MKHIFMHDTLDQSDVLHSGEELRKDLTKLDVPQENLVGRDISLFPTPCSQHPASQLAAEQKL